MFFLKRVSGRFATSQAQPVTVKTYCYKACFPLTPIISPPHSGHDKAMLGWSDRNQRGTGLQTQVPFLAGLLLSLEMTGAIDVTGMALCEGVRGLPEAFPIFCPWFQKVLRATVFVRELLQPGKGLLSGPAPAFCSALRLSGQWQDLVIHRTWATNRNPVKTTHSRL